MAKRKQSQLRPSADLLRGIILTFIVIVTLFLIVRGLVVYATRSELFVVKTVSIAESVGTLDFPDLQKIKGKSIFSVDLEKLKAKIKNKQPALANLKVMRRFPDEIAITAVKRTPLASVSFNGRLLLIDKGGVLMGTPGKEDVELSVIKGVTPGKFASGETVTDARLNVAYEILSVFHDDNLLKAVPLRFIDVADPQKIVCKVGVDDERTFEIIVDSKSFRNKSSQMGTLLSRGEVDLAAVKYMDFRFDAPIIGQKKVKKQ